MFDNNKTRKTIINFKTIEKIIIKKENENKMTTNQRTIIDNLKINRLKVIDKETSLKKNDAITKKQNLLQMRQNRTRRQKLH